MLTRACVCSKHGDEQDCESEYAIHDGADMILEVVMDDSTKSQAAVMQAWLFLNVFDSKSLMVCLIAACHSQQPESWLR